MNNLMSSLIVSIQVVEMIFLQRKMQMTLIIFLNV